jgi:hypothetical protein
MHGDAAIVHLEYNHSDHRPLMLDTEYYVVPSSHQQIKQDKFEAKWLREDTFAEIVKEQWEAAAGSADLIDVLTKLKTMHAGLHAWDQRVLRGPKNTLDRPNVSWKR